MATLLAGLRHLSAPLTTAAVAARSTAAGTAPRAFASAPCIYDSIIRFHVIDRDGKRHTVKGLVGKSVAAAMYESGAFEDFDDFCYGPEQPEPDAHVYVSNEALPQLAGKSDAEALALDLCGSGTRDNSRMAAYLRLDKTMIDMVVAQAPNQPWATP